MSKTVLTQMEVKLQMLDSEISHIWDFTMGEFRNAFLEAAIGVGIKQWQPCLYMGRHTGASLDRLMGTLPLSEVQKRGRWKSETSVKRYEKRALVQEVYNSLTEAQQLAAQRKADGLEDVLRRRIQCAG